MEYHDAVHMAAQLGRLDLASALFAAVGLCLAIFGLIGYGHIRFKCSEIAREEAEKIAGAIAEKAANEYIVRELPEIIKEYTNFSSDAVNSDTADAIANAQGELGKEG